jgi:hypothetical protein
MFVNTYTIFLKTTFHFWFINITENFKSTEIDIGIPNRDCKIRIDVVIDMVASRNILHRLNKDKSGNMML